MPSRQPKAAPSRAVLLARISDAEWVMTAQGLRVLDTHGVTGQVEDLLDLAAEQGWSVGPAETHHITENDVSAYRVKMVTLPDGRRELRPKRPEFWRALAMLRDGRADGVLTVDLDRTARHPRDLEDLIEVVTVHQVPVVDIAGEINLNTQPGRARARQKVAHANESSADTSRRSARGNRRHALAGYHLGGPRRFGFQAVPADDEDNKVLTVVESEADEIRAWAASVLDGVSLRQISLDVRDRGLKTTKGHNWSPTSIRNTLLHPAIMGKLVYRPAHDPGAPKPAADRLYSQDDIVGDAPWPRIIEEDDYWAVRAILTDPSRHRGPGNTPKWLLSGIAFCGLCQGVIGVRYHRGRRVYRCRGCDGQLHDGDQADRFVTEYMCGWLSGPEAADLLPRHSTVPRTDREALEREEARLITKMETQAALHAADDITDTQLITGTKILKERLATVRAELRDTNQYSPLSRIAGRKDARQVWENLTLGYRRAILRLLVTIEMRPGPVEAGAIAIEWNHLK